MERRGRSSERRRRTWSYRCKEYLRQFIAFMFSNIGIIGLVVGYTMAGSAMFMALEREAYKNRLTEVMKIRNDTAMELWKKTCCDVYDEPMWKNIVQAELVRFQNKIVEEVLNHSYEGQFATTNRWSFSGSFLYSLSVITTIGYGNVAPRTEWGKLATIVYAIAGMPLFLLYLSNIGDILAKSFKWIYAKCHRFQGCSSCLTKYPPGHPQHPRSQMQGRHTEEGEGADLEYSDEDEWSSEAGTDPQTITVPITLCLAIMVGYVCSGALLFAEWEHWGFLDASYFCFISLSTIGFGDIVPKDKEGTSFKGVELSFIFCSMYLMLGMALIAMCFNLMQEEVVHKVRTCGVVLKRIILCKR
ncbi:potassium channel subfamily K member 18 isoform X2 [Macrosteles quadrilineatus]|nr:potassium channel subfamily K member 18 isoform X2 [Macrosteles quadrilineatus]